MAARYGQRRAWVGDVPVAHNSRTETRLAEVFPSAEVRPMRLSLTIVRWLIAVFIVAMTWIGLGIPAIGMILAVRALPAVHLPTLTAEQIALLDNKEVGSKSPRIQLGQCYREQIGELTHIHLEGPVAELGFYQGVLVGDSIARIETEMMGVFTERIPNFFARHVILGLVSWNNRNLDSYFLPEELVEIAAITEGHRRYHDPYAAVSPSFTRGLQYHALHDISQYLIDNPLVHPPQIGCTAVAVKGNRTTDGHVLVGRLFDFEGGTCFDRDKVIYTVKPDGGIPFVSVAWGGMAGAVTGMNEAGLWVSINSAATDGQAFVGRPIVMVVRQILEHCHTIDEALAIIKTAEVFVSDGILLASGLDHRVVVAEKGPHGMGVRTMEKDELVLTNHFLSEAWKGDKNNANRMVSGTTTKRFERATDLLTQRRWHNAGSVLELLRNRRGVDDVDIGFGNRGSINAWIGAHLVVADVSDRVLWVCEPYHGLGKAIAFGIHGPVQREPLPASEDLAFHQLNGDAYLQLEQRVLTNIKYGQTEEAKSLADELMKLNPQGFHAYVLRARCATVPAERRRLLERALALQPAYPADKQAIIDEIAELP
jgi:predicted choloylglycine hydrolase